MLLSDTDIIGALRRGEITISPLIEENIQSASIDVTLSSIVRVFDQNNDIEFIDVKNHIDYSQLLNLEKQGSIIVKPNDFILGSTVEKITLPNFLAAKIEGRSSLGRLGLLIQTTAGYIAPGFSGNITLEISNISQIPIKIYVGMRIAQIALIKMSSPVSKPYGSPELKNKYQYQEGATPSKSWKDFEQE